MTLQQIKYVLQIARSGSISKASQNLFIAQPYLSNTLRALEKELGITIFFRRHKGVDLTPDGKEFLSYAKPLLDQEEKILELYSRHQVSPIFRFNISTQRYPFIIKAFMKFFHQLDPREFEIHLLETDMYTAISDVFNKKSEIGIIFLSNHTEQFLLKYLQAKKLTFHEICQITPCVFFRKDHPMAGNEAIALEQMGTYPFVFFELETAISADFAEEILLKNFTATKQRFIVNDRQTVYSLLNHSDAFSIGTGILSQGFADDNLVSIPIIGHENEIRLGWIHCDGYIPSAIERSFIDEIKRTLEE